MLKAAASWPSTFQMPCWQHALKWQGSGCALRARHNHSDPAVAASNIRSYLIVRQRHQPHLSCGGLELEHPVGSARHVPQSLP